MTRTLLNILCILISVNLVNAKGGQGTYSLQGIMYEKGTNIPLRNKVFLINKDTVITDSIGRYEYLVHWKAIEKPKVFWQKKKCNKIMAELNPKSILIVYKDQQIEIPNDWRKYGANARSRDEEILQKNFYW